MIKTTSCYLLVYAIQCGVIYAESQGVVLTKGGNGEMATAIGLGVGKPTDSGHMRFLGVAFYRADLALTLVFLNNLMVVEEYEVDESCNYTVRLWEWK